jgi:hypothetical protein
MDRPKQRPSTLSQRMALFNMYTALRWDLKGIRDMSFEEASKAIDKASKHIDKSGFPKRIEKDEQEDS